VNIFHKNQPKYLNGLHSLSNVIPHGSIPKLQLFQPTWLKQRNTSTRCFRKTIVLSRLVKLCTCHTYLPFSSLKRVSHVTHNSSSTIMVNFISSLSMILFHVTLSTKWSLIWLSPPSYLPLYELDTSRVRIVSHNKSPSVQLDSP